MSLNEPEHPTERIPSISLSSLSENSAIYAYDNSRNDSLREEHDKFLTTFKQRYSTTELQSRYGSTCTVGDLSRISDTLTGAQQLQNLQFKRLQRRKRGQRYRTSDRKSVASLFSTGSKYQHLKPEAVTDLVKYRTYVEDIRNVAVATLHHELVRQLQVIYNTNVCKVAVYEIPEVPYRVFSWSLNDYQVRRNLKNTVWVDVLTMDIPEDCLNIVKLNNDLEELFNHVQLIFNAFESQDIFDIDEAVYKIDKAYDFLNIFELLLSEMIQNRNAFREAINRSLNTVLIRGDSKQQEFKTELEEKLLIYDVIAPIEMRHQINFYGEKGNQSEYRVIAMCKKFTDEIKHYEKLVQREKYCVECTLNTYYTMIEKFKGNITSLTARYDEQYDIVDNDISYKKLSIEKLRDSRNFLEEQIIHFHEEIEDFRLRELRDREMELKRQQELEERGPEIPEKGKGKKKQKSKK